MHPAQSTPLELRMHVYVRAIQGVSLGIMIVKEPAIGNTGVGVLSIGIRAHVNDQAGGGSYDHAILLDHQLSLGKQPHVIRELPPIPHHVLLDHAGETQLVQRDQRVDVGFSHGPEQDLARLRGVGLRVHPLLMPGIQSAGNEPLDTLPTKYKVY